ncbi:3-oxoadipate enol-lactonase [Pseudomonas sp. 10B1]|uniref:3-oxoadipate enol-lactonase n=1 Tax=unclassified Pseudomonas TaxID=196821 RepID=UPI002AB58149|nr:MULTISPECIES: 3-oxoadipate enol-lactonase [unclassified Pseudomonas]MDY7561739.1 3-oxoadipate enol-lactonase [Pseudomonas sp. AB6]MEA9978988.1 3-oxoadipate enol-lactonase [Pseudomonas sp. RTS4]MEA9996345.1 3-oxoadipate enol-lactonase [Pseudomonas sp. AA4]MEB0085849.1 3-oxoadipate enol-lactonase [Pseudomonas sp. RTI1]MEB0125826.1 3-oxoadipate enol-lactonase [Pseudomonas sp. CCC1.2]
MGFLQLADGDLHYQLEGPEGAPVLVLSNSLGTNLQMWDTQMPTFIKYFRVLRYDTRGHGRSLVTPGPYSIRQLAIDVLTLLDGLSIPQAHFCGISMGGLIGQWLGIHANERLRKLVLCNTAAKIGGPQMWESRIATIQRDGGSAMAALRDESVARWFTPGFEDAYPEKVTPITDMLAASSPEGYVACCAAVRDADFSDQLGSISAPTLVISGILDPVTPPAGGRFLNEHIPYSLLEEVHAAHLSNIEAGDVFTSHVREFLLG